MRSSLTPAVWDMACRIFRRLGEAQSRRVVVSPIHSGSGFVSTAHGLYPVPAPATAYLLKGAPLYSTHIPGELITPTGAAILRQLAAAFGPLPRMTISAVGYGAGTKEREIAGVVRHFLGEAAAEAVTEPVTELMANIDDMNPQVFEQLVDLLFAAGALDVWLAPVQIKKHRPGTVLHVLARPEQADALSHAMLAESATLGVRRQGLAHIALERAFQTVQTAWGEVRIKEGRWRRSTKTAENWPGSTACRSRRSWPPPRRRRRLPSGSATQTGK